MQTTNTPSTLVPAIPKFPPLFGGGWFCKSCNAGTERVESDHGQPACCAGCGSPRIVYYRPVHSLAREELVLV